MRFICILFLVLLLSCSNSKKKTSAKEIIDSSIKASGFNKIKNSKISFTFRDKNYTAVRKNGVFKFTRNFDSIEDILTNDNFNRFINSNKIALNDSIANAYKNSVNSVHYFSVLPYGLNDKAVNKKLLPSVTIKNNEYFKIKISFSKDGGGEDYEDVFVYWINKQDLLVDYLAYSYKTNGGGKRFRTLKGENLTNSIHFRNYDNYKPINKHISLIELDKAYEANELEKVSEIVLDNIEVNFLTN
jgi:hypothetical protein